ncbi:MAG TPA: flagellar export chaperone FlgN [Clostridia bacterium]|nr:flagellar export chaperone FlgN [Clostridia bacterium]
MDTANNMIAELMSLLEKKKQLFDEIMVVTLEQKKDIEENKAENIEKLVGNKQSLIDSIDKIDKVFSDRLNMLKKGLGINSLEDADFTKYPMLKALKLKVGEIVVLAQKIMEIENYNKEKLTLIMNGLKAEMKQMSIGKRSIKAYDKPAVYNDGIYIDKKK